MADAGSGEGGLSVGEAAARIGVAPSTLRTWERRYALAPSSRSSGGHRRYTAADVALLRLVHGLVLAGETPARAALLARRQAEAAGADGRAGGHGSDPGRDGQGGLTGRPGGRPPGRLAGRPEDGHRDRSEASDDGDRASRRGGPGGRVLALPGADARARGLARAATALDVDEAAAIIEAALTSDGVVRSWDTLVRPVLGAAGSHWARTGEGVEVEHLLTEATIEALRAHRRHLPRPDTDLPPVVLACAPNDQHTLPLQVLSAALRESGRAARVLGARVPGDALAATVRRVGARAAFVWAQLPDPRAVDALRLPPSRPAVRLVVGGPGWDAAELPEGVLVAADLEQALAALRSL